MLFNLSPTEAKNYNWLKLPFHNHLKLHVKAMIEQFYQQAVQDEQGKLQFPT
jgi:hypothetical protein